MMHPWIAGQVASARSREVEERARRYYALGLDRSRPRSGARRLLAALARHRSRLGYPARSHPRLFRHLHRRPPAQVPSGRG